MAHRWRVEVFLATLRALSVVEPPPEDRASIEGLAFEVCAALWAIDLLPELVCLRCGGLYRPRGVLQSPNPNCGRRPPDHAQAAKF